MNVRFHVFVMGRVQGVFFRFETHRAAQKHGVKGWIKNLPDGRVETVFEGDEENVKKLIEFCKKGPSQAKVTHIEVTQESYKGTFSSFQIQS